MDKGRTNDGHKHCLGDSSRSEVVGSAANLPYGKLAAIDSALQEFGAPNSNLPTQGALLRKLEKLRKTIGLIEGDTKKKSDQIRYLMEENKRLRSALRKVTIFCRSSLRLLRVLTVRCFQGDTSANGRNLSRV